MIDGLVVILRNFKGLTYINVKVSIASYCLRMSIAS